MDRRAFIGGVAGGFSAAAVAARAQGGKGLSDRYCRVHTRHTERGQSRRTALGPAGSGLRRRAKPGDRISIGRWSAARALGLQAELLDVRSQGDLGPALDRAARRHFDALLVGADGLTQMHQQAIVAALARHRLPAAYPASEFVEAGGSIAYAVNYPDLYFRYAGLVDKVFKGATPGELPIQQPTRFELGINLGTAKALGLTIPQSLLLRADDMIE